MSSSPSISLTFTFGPRAFFASSRRTLPISSSVPNPITVRLPDRDAFGSKEVFWSCDPPVPLAQPASNRAEAVSTEKYTGTRRRCMVAPTRLTSTPSERRAPETAVSAYPLLLNPSPPPSADPARAQSPPPRTQSGHPENQSGPPRSQRSQSHP